MLSTSIFKESVQRERRSHWRKVPIPDSLVFRSNCELNDNGYKLRQRRQVLHRNCTAETVRNAAGKYLRLTHKTKAERLIPEESRRRRDVTSPGDRGSFRYFSGHSGTKFQHLALIYTI